MGLDIQNSHGTRFEHSSLMVLRQEGQSYQLMRVPPPKVAPARMLMPASAAQFWRNSSLMWPRTLEACLASHQYGSASNMLCQSQQP